MKITGTVEYIGGSRLGFRGNDESGQVIEGLTLEEMLIGFLGRDPAKKFEIALDVSEYPVVDVRTLRTGRIENPDGV